MKNKYEYAKVRRPFVQLSTEGRTRSVVVGSDTTEFMEWINRNGACGRLLVHLGDTHAIFVEEVEP